MSKRENEKAQQILFEDLKDLAIKKTLEYFKDEHNIKGDALILNSHLDLEKQTVKSQLKTNDTYLDIGEYDKLKNKLFHYFSEMRRAISDFETDNLGLMTNGLNNSKEETIKDYCSVTFYSLFHSSELKNIKGIELTENRNKHLQKSKDKKHDEVSNKIENPYPNIFRNNAFEVWKSMYDSFEINESSRTDVKFMYEVMKKDGLIFKTVNQKTFLDWISQTYQIVIQKTSNYSKTPIRNNTYSNAKQLYKALDA